MWCSACGAYASGVAKGLAKPCLGRVRGWKGGGRHQQLLALRNGRHPKTGQWIGAAVPEAAWIHGELACPTQRATAAAATAAAAMVLAPHNRGADGDGEQQPPRDAAAATAERVRRPSLAKRRRRQWVRRRRWQCTRRRRRWWTAADAVPRSRSSGLSAVRPPNGPRRCGGASRTSRLSRHSQRCALEMSPSPRVTGRATQPPPRQARLSRITPIAAMTRRAMLPSRLTSADGLAADANPWRGGRWMLRRLLLNVLTGRAMKLLHDARTRCGNAARSILVQPR